MKQWLTIIAVFLGSLLATAFVGFLLALILVGPHSDILPHVLHVPVGLLLWLVVLGIPSWLSWITYRKIKRRDNET